MPKGITSLEVYDTGTNVKAFEVVFGDFTKGKKQALTSVIKRYDNLSNARKGILKSTINELAQEGDYEVWYTDSASSPDPALKVVKNESNGVVTIVAYKLNSATGSGGPNYSIAFSLDRDLFNIRYGNIRFMPDYIKGVISEVGDTLPYTP